MSKFEDFIEAIKVGNIKVVKQRFNRSYITKIWNGGTALHWATLHNNRDIVKFLIGQGSNIECDTTVDLVEKVAFGIAKPIHIAAHYGDISTIESLINANCKLDCVTSSGERPIEIVTRLEKDDCVELIRSEMNYRQQGIEDATYLLYLLRNNRLTKITDSGTGETLLDKLMNNSGPGIQDAIVFKQVEEEEIKELQTLRSMGVSEASYQLLYECLLYRSMRQEYHRGFKALCTADIANKASFFGGSSALECAVRSGIVSWVDHVLRRLIDIDESWSRAKALANEKQFIDIMELLTERRLYLERRQARGYSRLHIAVYDNAPDVIDYILTNQLVDPNEGNMTVGSALSLAYEMDFQRCVKSLQHFKVNPNTTNVVQMTPLSMAISNKIEDNCDYLIDNISDIEAKDYLGLTPIYRCVLNRCEKISEKLMKKGLILDYFVNMDSEIFDRDLDIALIRQKHDIQLTNHETVYSLCLKIDRTIYPCLFSTLDQQNINMVDGNDNTLLHLCASFLNNDLCMKLIEKGADLNLTNRNNNTPLVEMLTNNYHNNITKVDNGVLLTLKVLIEGGARIDINGDGDCSVFETATKYDSEELLLVLIDRRDALKTMKQTDFEVWLRKGYVSLLEKALPAMRDLGMTDLITANIIAGCLDTVPLYLLKDIFYTASLEIQSAVVEGILHRAAADNDENVFKGLLETPVSTESSVVEGKSLVNYLLKEKKNNFIEMVLSSKNGLFLSEKKDNVNQTPLHACITSENWDMFDTLLAQILLIDEEDDNGDTPVSLLFTKISEAEQDVVIRPLMTKSMMLINQSADIFKINKLGKSIVSYLTKTILREQIEDHFKRRRTSSMISLQRN